MNLNVFLLFYCKIIMNSIWLNHIIFCQFIRAPTTVTSAQEFYACYLVDEIYNGLTNDCGSASATVELVVDQLTFELGNFIISENGGSFDATDGHGIFISAAGVDDSATSLLGADGAITACNGGTCEGYMVTKIVSSQGIGPNSGIWNFDDASTQYATDLSDAWTNLECANPNANGNTCTITLDPCPLQTYCTWDGTGDTCVANDAEVWKHARSFPILLKKNIFKLRFYKSFTKRAVSFDKSVVFLCVNSVQLN